MLINRNSAKLLFVFLVASSFTVLTVNAFTGEWWLMQVQDGFNTRLYRYDKQIGNTTITDLGFTEDYINSGFLGENQYIVTDVGVLYYAVLRSGNAPNGIRLYNSTDKGTTLNYMKTLVNLDGITHVSIDYSTLTGYIHFVYTRSYCLYYGNYSIVTDTVMVDTVNYIIDGTNSDSGCSIICDSQNRVYTHLVSGKLGSANKRFQFVQRLTVGGGWSGIYQETNGGTYGITRGTLLFDELNNIIIGSWWNNQDSAVYIAYHNYTDGVDVWSGWDRATLTDTNAVYYMSHEDETRSVCILSPKACGGDYRITSNYSPYPYNVFTRYASCNYTGLDFINPLMFDRQYTQNKIAMTNNNPFPFLEFLCNENFLMSSKKVVDWLANTKRFPLNHTGSVSMWTVWDEAYLIDIPYPEIYNVTIPDIDGVYLMSGKKYSLVAEVENVHYLRLNFTDGNNNIAFIYNSTYNQFNILCVGSGVISLLDSENSTKNTLDILTWEFILLDNIVDSSCDLDGQITFTWLTQTYQNNYTDLLSFNIFNLGGGIEYDTGGNGEHIKGGNPESVSAYGSGSYAQATTTWDKLQHTHLTVELDNGGIWDAVNNKFINMTGGFFEFGINYFINNTMLDGWKSRLYVESSDVGNHDAGNDMDWVDWTVEHFIYNRTSSLWDLKKEDGLISNYDGYDHIDSSHGYADKTTVKFYIDLWFSNENSSRVIATRINPEYFGMYEQGNPFWFGYGSFRPLLGNETVSIFYDNIYDENMNVVSSRGKITLTQFWVRVEKVTGKEVYTINNFVMKNNQLASYYMDGIDTPAYVTTKVLDMPLTGFLTPLIKAINGIGSLIWGACMGFVYALISGIDGLLVFLGLPEGMFSSMINWVSIQASTIWSWISTVTSYTVDMLYVFVQLANFIISFMGYILSAITWVVIWVLPIPLHIFLFILAIITSSSWTYGGYTWYFSAYSDITGAFWAIAPYMIAWGFSVWLFLGQGDDIGGFPHRLMDTFRFIKEGYTNLFWIFNHMRNEIITMYNFVRSHIPFLGSGGGETEE